MATSTTVATVASTADAGRASGRQRFRRFYRRRFLNRPRHHQGAHVIADVRVRRWEDGTSTVSAELHLADCHRCVTIDLDAHDRAGASNALRKVALLREVVVDLEDALTRAVRDADLLR